MKIETSSEMIFKEYNNAVGYNLSENYYSNIKKFENFYIGKQWEGINAPDLDKPVLNFIKRVCSFLVSMVVNDDISIYVSPFIINKDGSKVSDILNNQLEKVMEISRIKALSRQVIKDCVVTGDGILYWFYEDGTVKGQVLQGKNVLFANPYINNVEKQPYILIDKYEYLEEVIDKASANGGQADKIKTNDGYNQGFDCAPMVQTVVKLYKKDGQVWYTQVTKDAVIIPPVCLGYNYYPIAKISWELQNDSYHGVGAVDNLIPNQIAVNKLWAMALQHQKTMAFPKIFFDKTKIDSWTNKVGAAIGVIGNPNDAIATSFKASDMSDQLMLLVEKTISYTKDFMGANDNSLGNVTPNNTSAIMAVQKSAMIPLETQKYAYHQLLEDSVKIILDIIGREYGERLIDCSNDSFNEGILFDFSTIDNTALDCNIEVGDSSVWTQGLQAQSLQDLYEKGILTDMYDYVQAIPSNQLRNKQKILKKIQETKLEK